MKKFSKRLLALLSGVLPAALLAFAISCADPKANEVFKKPALERLQEDMSSLRAKLQASPQGWTIFYRPSKTETGYYQFLFRFLNDTEVEMASDFSSDDLPMRKSEYAILIGSAVKLSFATGSSIHKLSDSYNSPIPGLRGAGLKGDFEFLYYGEDAQGNLMFRTNRTNEPLLFKKATDKSWEELSESLGNLYKLNHAKSVYRALSESKDGAVFNSSFSFPYNARVIQIQGVAETNANGKTQKPLDEEGYISGFGLTSEGIFFDSLARHSGEVLKNVAMKYNPGAGRFETVLADGTLLAFGDLNAPLIPADGQKYFLDPTLTKYISTDSGDLVLGDLTTEAFNTLIGKYSKIGLNGEIVLYRQTDVGGTKYDFALLDGTASASGRAVIQLLTYEDKGDRLVMKKNGYLNLNSSVKPNNQAKFNEFLDFLTDPQGFYVENLGTGPSFSNLIFTFTSAKDTSIRFALYHVTP